MKKIIVALAAVYLLALIGCSKSSNPANVDTAPTTKPAIPTLTVTGPQTQSSDSYAQTAQLYASVVNVYANFAAPYSQLPATQNGNTWTYGINQGGFSVTITATYNSDGSYTWRMVLNGTESGSSVSYTNWTAMEGTTSADGKSGSWNIYYDNSTQESAAFSFSTNASGDVTSHLIAYNEDGTVDGKYDFINNHDNSGELSFYTNDVLVMKITWQSDGTGSWWTYDEQTGVQIGHDTWT